MSKEGGVAALDPAAVVDYIECVHQTLEQASRELAQKEAELALTKTASARVQELIPQAVEALIQNERIDPADKVKAAAKLADPVALLEILIKTADPNNTIRPRQLGAAVRQKDGQKEASDYSNHAGRRTSDLKESDRRWFENLGVSIPDGM